MYIYLDTKSRAQDSQFFKFFFSIFCFFVVYQSFFTYSYYIQNTCALLCIDKTGPNERTMQRQ